MPNRIPIEVGGIYHVFNRGVDKRKIFMNNQDYARFVLGLYFFNDKEEHYDIWTNLQNRKQYILSILGLSGGPSAAGIADSQATNEDEREHLIDLFAFTLMPNHFHFILREIKEGGISDFMKKMGSYAQYFNTQHDRTGSLFQGRYKAVHIESDEQLRTAFVYVHTNPVELKEPSWKEWKVTNGQAALSSLGDYRWSSYGDYIGKPTFPAVTEREFFLDFFGSEQDCKQAIEDWVLFKAENAGFDGKVLE